MSDLTDLYTDLYTYDVEGAEGIVLSARDDALSIFASSDGNPSFQPVRIDRAEAARLRDALTAWLDGDGPARNTAAGTAARGRQPVTSHPKPTGPVPIGKPITRGDT
jgi:hypothetical protein